MACLMNAWRGCSDEALPTPPGLSRGPSPSEGRLWRECIHPAPEGSAQRPSETRPGDDGRAWTGLASSSRIVFLGEEPEHAVCGGSRCPESPSGHFCGGSRPDGGFIPADPPGGLRAALWAVSWVNLVPLCCGAVKTSESPMPTWRTGCHFCVCDLCPGTVSLCVWLSLKGQRLRVRLWCGPRGGRWVLGAGAEPWPHPAPPGSRTQGATGLCTVEPPDFPEHVSPGMEVRGQSLKPVVTWAGRPPCRVDAA